MNADTHAEAGNRDLLAAGGSNRNPDPAAGAASKSGARAGLAQPRAGDARSAVTALYQVHAIGLIRLAVVMTGDRPTAEDVVQEAFCGLFRRWPHLVNKEKALAYVRSATLNGCRSEFRRRIRNEQRAARNAVAESAESAEYAALIGEEHRAVLTALRQLPNRQREALVLRFYLELSEPEIAAAMGISPGTVKSTTSRALAALGRLLGEDR